MGGGDEAEGGDGPDPAGGVWTRGRRSISRAFPQNHPRPRPASRLFLPLDLPRSSARAKRRYQSCSRAREDQLGRKIMPTMMTMMTEMMRKRTASTSQEGNNPASNQTLRGSMKTCSSFFNKTNRI